jgi:TonB-linked SusC/RagA family outer membrane protein
MKCSNVYALVFSFFLLFVMDAKAFTQSALDKRITIEVKNTEVKRVLKIIEKLADIKLAYSAENISKAQISVSARDQTVNDVLKQVLYNQNMSYEAVGDLVVIHKKNEIVNIVEVTGKVLDETGLPLPGVTVKVKGSEQSTSTDASGKFAINLTNTNTALVFSFVGYNTQEVSLNGRTVINITMEPNQKSLSEVVVVGYGTQKRENVVGSIVQISGDKLANRPVTQLQNALTGQLPGVTVTQSNGRPGFASGAISIRGVGSFGADPSPFILVDGIPTDGFNDIDPNDVESISVLKDASSAAIYGARAANGVILVTTKSGTKGKVKVNYSGYFGTQVATALPEFVNSWEYATAYNEGSPSPTFTPEEIQKFKDGSDPDNYPNTRFLDLIMKKHTSQTGHNASVSGGNDANVYNVSFGYLYQDGLVARENYAKYNGRFNMTTNISPKLSLTTRLSAISADVNEPTTNVLGLIGDAIKLPGNLVAVYSNGDYGVGLGSNGTPVSRLAGKAFNKGNNLNLNGNARLDYKPFPGLKLSGITSYVRTELDSTAFAATQQLRGGIIDGPNSLTRKNAKTNYYTFQGTADYTKQFGKHQINVLLGYSFEETKSDNFVASRNDFPGNDLTELDLGSPASQTNSGTGSEWAIESEFARLNYSFASKYLVEGVVRRDGSSRFPTDNKYAYFPSVAIGWRIGQESFIKNNYSWVSELKIKASRGTLGNQNIRSNYPYQNTLGVVNGNTGTDYSFGGTVVPGVARTQIVDNNLHWESTRTTDVGVEFGLFKNAITGSATYFNRYSYDILYSPSNSVSNVLGFGLSQQNTGSLENKGWEFTLNYNSQIGKVGLNISTNFTIINNKALDLGVGNITQPNGLVGNGSDLFIGYPMQLYYGYVADGLFKDAADVASWPKYSTSITAASKPGDIRYKDISGPKGVPDGVVDPTYDRVYLGSQIPKYTYGANIGVTFHGFDASVLLQAITGVKGNLTGNYGFALNNGANIQRWQYEERWTEANPNPHAAYPRVEVLSSAGSANTPLSSFWILNGSYLRVKNAQIGYTFTKKLMQSVGIANARIYLSGENLLTIDNYRKGWDPEVNTGTNFYPILTNYTLGVNVTF